MLGSLIQSRSTVVLALAAIGLSVSAALAQDLVAPDGRSVRPTALERTCAAALERFCPELAPNPGQTRSQQICLRPYRSSLSPPCRAAVKAGLK